MPEINDTTTYPVTVPALTDITIGTDVSNTTNDPNGEVINFSWQGVMDLFEANFQAPASILSSGTLADARIAASNVTQHQASLSITESQISNLGTLALLTSDLGATVQAFDADTLKADVSDNLTVGFTSTSADLGTVTTTTTLNPATSNVQHYINGGAHTLNPPSANCTMLVDVTNNASAGAITTSGWDLVDGDSFTTTDTHRFRLFVSVNDGFSLLTVKALQ